MHLFIVSGISMLVNFIKRSYVRFDIYVDLKISFCFQLFQENVYQFKNNKCEPKLATNFSKNGICLLLKIICYLYIGLFRL